MTATEIKIGNTAAYSGPASAYGIIAKTEAAFFQMVNDQGGVGGRKIIYDFARRRLQPAEDGRSGAPVGGAGRVAFIFATIGTPPNTAIFRYTNSKGVPLLFLGSGANKWGDYKATPWVMGWQPSYRTEAQIYTAYAKEQQAWREDRHPLSERRLRQGLPARRQGRAGRQIRQHGEDRFLRSNRCDDRLAGCWN